MSKPNRAARRAAAVVAAKARAGVPDAKGNTRADLRANGVTVDRPNPSRMTVSIDKRSQLVGEGMSAGDFFQAGSNNSQIPLIGNPTPSSMVSMNWRFRALSRYLRANNPWMRGVVDRLLDRVVGEGPTPDFKSPVLKKLWAESCPYLDSRRKMSFGQWLHALTKSFVVDGESFARVVRTTPTGIDEDGYLTFGEDASPIGFELRSMSAEFVPENYSEWGGSFQGTPAWSNYGVIMNADNLDKTLGYWCYDFHPYDTPSVVTGRFMAQQVAKADVAHLHIPPLEGSVRGEIRMTPVLIRALRLEGYEDAEMQRKQLDNALNFILTEDPLSAGEALLPGEVDEETGEPLAGPDGEARYDIDSLRTEFSIRPGSINKMPAGFKVEIHDPKPTPQTDNWWTRFQILAFASCFGLPNYEVTQDYESLKSDRVAKVAIGNLRATVNRERGVITTQVLDWLIRLFVDDAIMSGRYVLQEGERRKDLYNVTWDWPPLPDATLAQDIKAACQAIEAKLIDRDQVTKDLFNKDPEETNRKIAKIAARDTNYGFNQEPLAVLRPDGSVIPFWAPNTPTSLKLLQEVLQEEGDGGIPSSPMDVYPAISQT